MGHEFFLATAQDLSEGGKDTFRQRLVTATDMLLGKMVFYLLLQRDKFGVGKCLIKTDQNFRQG